MSALRTTAILAVAAALFSSTSQVLAAPCMVVTLTGTQGGPPVFNGQAGSGTLVQYGNDENNCSDVNLQFDTGRGTTQQLSKLKVPVGKLNAVFLSHLHSDHTEGLSDMLQLRWHFNSGGPKVDLVCSGDAVAKVGYTLSCEKFAEHIGDPLIHSGEIAQRLVNLKTFAGKDEKTTVWESGDVAVHAVASSHIAGHASYRVDTPAGSVVIGVQNFHHQFSGDNQPLQTLDQWPNVPVQIN